MKAPGSEMTGALPGSTSTNHDPILSAEQAVFQLGTLVGDLRAPSRVASSATATTLSHLPIDNRLIEVRLGLASSLFAALGHKHEPTAAHSLRVALGCSSWALVTGMCDEEREELEVAALLHDIGKIGAPDRLLLKPMELQEEELNQMDNHRLAGLDILANCCPRQGIVDIIRNSAGWYDGSRPNYSLAGDQIPLGARMLAIVDAFDSMTIDQPYRQAASRERALHELVCNGGKQFDPDLVQSFSELHLSVQLHQQVIDHWLKTLKARESNRFWSQAATAIPDLEMPSGEALFQQKLLENMHDAVVFVDRDLRIIGWNRGAERLTGISRASVWHRHWSPMLIGLGDDKKAPLTMSDCPLACCMLSGHPSQRRLIVSSRQKQPLAVDVQSVPVMSDDGVLQGATMVLHDASSETTLEEQCNSLHERATKDPLTQVANRAEFDRMHQMFVSVHLERQLPCSLIICDIDHFKSINDTFGHQAGDDVLRSFGSVLKSVCRNGDVVARYGGEEFVLLCVDCTNAAATRRAEELRQRIAALPQPVMEGNVVTASFGVTEIQPGDTPESMLRRADRALLEAKSLGRNLVV